MGKSRSNDEAEEEAESASHGWLINWQKGKVEIKVEYILQYGVAY